MSVETSQQMWAGPIRWMGKRMSLKETAAGKSGWRRAEQHRLLMCVRTTKTWIDDTKGSLEKVKFNWSK